MENLTEIAYDFGVRAFGSEHMNDPRIRGLRMVEEAVEAAQALGVERAEMHDLVNIVYDRPPGDVIQELGGTLLTTAVLCRIFGVSIEDVFLTEVRRVLNKSPDHFAKRNQEKMDLGLK